MLWRGWGRVFGGDCQRRRWGGFFEWIWWWWLCFSVDSWIVGQENMEVYIIYKAAIGLIRSSHLKVGTVFFQSCTCHHTG